MKIRCPHCQVIYNIPSSTLKEAGHKVVCSECHNIFSAAKGNPVDTGKTENTRANDAEMRELLEDLERSLEKHRNDKLGDEFSGPDFLPEAEFQEDQESLLPDTQPLDEITRPDTLLLDEHQDAPDAPDAGGEPPDHEPFAPELPDYRRKTSAATIFLSILLGLGILAQLAWLQRNPLLENPQIQKLAAKICPYFGCQPFPAEASQNFHVLDRLFEPYSAHPGAYRLDLLLRNDGSDPQPPPALQLGLLDTNQKVMARRTLPASVYQPEAPAGDRSLAPGKTLEVHLLLLPPQIGVSGFELNLLPAGS